MDPYGVVEQHFEGNATDARAARSFAVETLTWWGYEGSELERAVMLANELVTNAVLHARSSFELRILLYEDHLRIEVSDLNSRLPVPALVPSDATSGRGLLLVQAVATSWGVETQRNGKVVWAEMASDALKGRI